VPRSLCYTLPAAVYDACIALFCVLPVAALVDNLFFCDHGGFSPELVTSEGLYICFNLFVQLSVTHHNNSSADSKRLIQFI
jgi:hypothetical protein